ncbi:MAG: 2-oxoglutarate dehydrogenase complex dihydrolipoyllysine-residue succinyltransferase [Alphaproteobacteria bacterium]|nr:2-oxoglutarate dehydrogenase complex dihydrolipoyllysine-residue succinyltransferase [Alphaproteobacteria bacterium]MBP7759698.1 2-oxoglutarate dehydrogenase complex dihydrolipoyllysine-residue succinyltransferase [Alphaproteobacteria bacterium]MBP7762853.1 2-oxoglutarate dehydrogenase complex dihydrolipoyllysine-residue succinyltransferase [Alphaproteobacteria bacterium]MBP7905052.1 2-oxoglutarate dehydrogenase complex dihydrolipoyllysine-residue succinyltransferase [Alphaproteobacteria bact
MTKILVPTLGESVSEATVAQWLKKEGEAVKADEPIVELETDKVTLEVPAPADGVIVKIMAAAGQSVGVGAVLGEFEAGAVANDKGSAPKAVKAAPAPAKVAAADEDAKTSPAVRKLLADNKLDASQVPASGKDGRLTKEDIEAYLKGGAKAAAPAAKAPSAAPAPAAPAAKAPSAAPAPAAPVKAREAGPREEKVKMTKLRQVIARRLKEAQNTAAMLTTFNEVDMGPVMELRNEYKDAFEKKHGVKLGFMSFFVKAVIQALKDFPALNSEISGDEIIYKNYYDIGVAVSTPQGLVVPVLRDADSLSMAQIEAKIADLGTRARDGKLSLDEMVGGTYTITNGGVFGSLLSTPILNTPQSGILGMHAIQKRPVVCPKTGAIVAKPMMYLAQSYDHRIVDGREAVGSLVRIKQAIEDPQRLLLDV